MAPESTKESPATLNLTEPSNVRSAVIVESVTPASTTTLFVTAKLLPLIEKSLAANSIDFE